MWMWLSRVPLHNHHGESHRAATNTLVGVRAISQGACRTTGGNDEVERIDDDPESALSDMQKLLCAYGMRDGIVAFAGAQLPGPEFEHVGAGRSDEQRRRSAPRPLPQRARGRRGDEGGVGWTSQVHQIG